MATFNKFNKFVEDLAFGVHNFTSDSTCTITIALTAVAPIATNSVLANLTQISYTNISDRVVTISASGHTTGTYKLTLTDKTLTASGTTAAFRYVVLYNDDPTSPADPLIGYYDYGSSITLATGETFTIDFDGDNGVLTLA
jgi:hypothetical protein